MEKLKKYIWVAIVVILCIIAFIARINAINMVQNVRGSDMRNYHNMANNFIENGILGYSNDGKALEPNAHVTPGYPLFLSAVYCIFGENEAEDMYAVKIVQAVLSTLTVLVVFLIGKKICNNFVGLIAAMFMVMYPTFLIVATLHLTETLYIFLFVVYLYIQLIAFDTNKKWIHFITGIIFGLAVMVRPVIFPMVLVIYLYKWIVNGEKRVIKGLLFFILGLLIIMLPWWIRNIVLFNDFIVLCTQTGNPMFAGAYPPEFSPKSYPPIEEQFDAAIEAIITGFVEHPKEYIKWFTIDKFKLIFDKMYLMGFMPQLKFMINIHKVCVYVGILSALFGLFRKNVNVLALYVIMLIIAHLLSVPESRYAMTIMPLLMLLTAYIFVHIVKVLWKKLTYKNY